MFVVGVFFVLMKFKILFFRSPARPRSRRFIYEPFRPQMSLSVRLRVPACTLTRW